LGRTALSELAGSTLPSARRAARLIEDAHRAASAAASVRIVLGAVAGAALTLAVAATGLAWPLTLLVSALVCAVAALLVIRHVPRRIGRAHPLGTVLVTSAVLVGAHALVGVVRRSGRVEADHPDLTEDEIRDMVDRVSESERIEDDEREMFRSVLELGDTITRAVMVPRTEMITLPSGTPLRKALALFLRSGYSRIPVVGESVDDPVGILYLKDLVRHRHLNAGSDDVPVDQLTRTPVYVPESKPVDELLREMQQGASHIALVVDEFGGIAGLVTIEDALEEIVGELTDEHDHSGPEVEDLGDGTFRVPSRLPVDELGELFDLELDDDDVDTAGGLLAKALGKVPLVGSRAEVGGLVLTADRVEGRRKQVSTLVVRRGDAAGTDQAPPTSTTSQGAHR
ncbi:MAG: HlyC/CorC family transporter, partial [Cellulomonadaceae bacterium]|nr:HlyC/CorC family transporter [Cellulomonadaceae bacterium]